MASRRYFTYDPYDYYYTSPYQYHYPYPYHQYQHPAPSRGFFPAAAEAAPEPVRVAPRPRVESSTPVSIPVHFVGSSYPEEPERGAVSARMPAAAPKKRVMSADEAAVRLQAAARGLMARRSVRAVREVEREAEEAAGRIAREAEALRADARARVAVGEALMRMLLRLDAVRGAREYRKRVTRRVLALQDAVDALEPKTEAAAAAAAAEEPEATASVEMAEVAMGQPGDGEDSAVTEAEAETAPDVEGEMDVDGDHKADGEADAVEEPDQAQDDDKPEEGSGEWEMVTEEPEPAVAAALPEEPTTGQGSGSAAEAGAVDGALDTRKVMEMVAALCERSAQQCAVIGALADRVDALERAVRRVEDAERRRRRGKRLKKEGKGGNHNKCYSD